MAKDKHVKHYLTSQKREALEKELKELSTVKRKEILEDLEASKALGDLSENAEYQQAREEQARLEERIAEIEHILKTAEVVESHHSDRVEVGSTIVVLKEGDKEKKKYQIVGSDEVDMAVGKISPASPLGQALFGKRKGDKVEFKTPAGVVHYQIIDIE